MKSFLLPLIFACGFTANAQVGINTTTPETTLEVVGKPDKPDHFDGIIPPRISGDQLALKNYTPQKKGAVVYITTGATNPVGQVANVTNPGIYFFDGVQWQNMSKEYEPIEYRILLTFDENSTAPLTPTTNWLPEENQYGNTAAYRVSSRYYTIGTKNYNGLKGRISFRKLDGIVNVLFSLFKSNPSLVSQDTSIYIADVFRDIGYIPMQIALLHRDYSPAYFPALLQNFSITIPKDSFNSLSTDFGTYGEIQGYSQWVKPYLP